MAVGSLFQFGYRAEQKHLPVFGVKRNWNTVPYYRPDTVKQPDERGFGFVVRHNIHRVMPAPGVTGRQMTFNDADVAGSGFH